MPRSALVVVAGCVLATVARAEPPVARSPSVSAAAGDKAPGPPARTGAASGHRAPPSETPTTPTHPSAVEHHVALGADIGLVARTAKGDGISYRPGITAGVHADLPIVSWLTLSTFYLYARESVKLDSSAPFGTGAPISISGALTSYKLGARLEPTWGFDPRTRAWISVGAAWGVLSYPLLTVHEGDSYAIAPPDHPFVEIPFGIGGDYEVIAGWLSVQANAAFGVTVFEQSIPPVQSLRQSGVVISSNGLPGFSNSFTALAGAVLRL